jgi:hypothetical protein
MNSTRILLSDRHFHDLRLSERDISVIIHALVVLRAAFDEEPEYHKLIQNVLRKLRESLESPTTPENVIQPR